MKRFISILLIMLLAISFVGCNANKKENNDESAPVSYREQLEQVFIKEKGNVLYYSSADQNYAYTALINNIEEKPELTVITMDGTMLNITNENSVPQTFNVQYVINDNSIREIIKNYDLYKSDGNMETLNSIIPNQIILQGPLEEGNLWFQKFNYNGREYNAQTTLTKVSENEEGKKIYRTETVVKDIEGFSNNTYTEVREYEEGKGLVLFQNNKPVAGKSGTAKDASVFKYVLNSVQKVEENK